MTDIIDCGHIAGTHGVRGELRMICLLDDGLLERLETLWVGGAPFRLTAARPHKRHWLIKLGGVDTVEAAMALRGKAVTCRRDALGLPEGHYFYSDIYGFQVFDHRVGRVIGTLSEVRESPAGMLYAVETDETLFLIPAVEAFKRGIDFEGRRVEVETIPGMLPHEN